MIPPFPSIPGVNFIDKKLTAAEPIPSRIRTAANVCVLGACQALFQVPYAQASSRHRPISLVEKQSLSGAKHWGVRRAHAGSPAWHPHSEASQAVSPPRDHMPTKSRPGGASVDCSLNAPLLLPTLPLLLLLPHLRVLPRHPGSAQAITH